MRLPPLFLCLALALGPATALAQNSANAVYILQWNGGTLARFTGEEQVRNTPSDQPPRLAVVLSGARDPHEIADWNQARDLRTVILVICRSRQEVQRQTFYGASPQYLAMTPAGAELQMSYAQQLADPVASSGGGMASPCTQPEEPTATLFDRRFGRVWTVSTGAGRSDLWQYKSESGTAAYFGDRESTTVTIELAGDTYIVKYEGCEFRGRAEGGNVTLEPTRRAGGACSRNPGALHATIVR